MSLEPFYIVSNGLIALTVVMIGLCAWISRWKLAVFRFEREVMFLTMLATGFLNMLLSDAIPIDPAPDGSVKTYLVAGFLILLLQVLFWSAFLRLRKQHLADRKALAA